MPKCRICGKDVAPEDLKKNDSDELCCIDCITTNTMSIVGILKRLRLDLKVDATQIEVRITGLPFLNIVFKQQWKKGLRVVNEGRG